jgi:UDP-N-acetylglucosamine--N-acetylmuramyl-(pentapeptide) pyrophosphoryl-undecaprenol N-acetylglucosamine transferase
MSRRRSILIAVGPTEGHVQPALVFADAYQASHPDTDVHFAGPSAGPASKLLAARGARLHVIAGAPLTTVRLGARIAAVPHTLAGVWGARRLLRETSTRLVVGFGAYTSGSVLLAARVIGVRSAIHEANVVPGLTSRLLAPLVDRIYVGWPAVAHHFPTSKIVVVGNLVRPEIASVATTTRRPPGGVVRLLVLSGTGGSAFLASHVPPLVAEVVRGGLAVTVRHQCGQLDPAAIATYYATLGVTAVVERVIENPAEAYASADFVIARAGAGTIAELTAAAVPAVLVPLSSAAGDHQSANAMAYARLGGAIAVRESEWDRLTLAHHVMALLGDTRRWATVSTAARAAYIPDAAARMVTACEAHMAGYW